MKARIEVTINVEDSAAVVAAARERYAADGATVDCEGMSEEEALAVADLSTAQMREHPRYVVPAQAIAHAAEGAVFLMVGALREVGVDVESSRTVILDRLRGVPVRRRPEPRHTERRGAIRRQRRRGKP